jgi:hypothetical protein
MGNKGCSPISMVEESFDSLHLFGVVYYTPSRAFVTNMNSYIQKYPLLSPIFFPLAARVHLNYNSCICIIVVVRLVRE